MITSIFRCVFVVFSIVFCGDILAQSTASQQVTKFNIEAPQLGATKTIWVYLPKTYQTSNKSYPTIYMHDAQNLFDKETSYIGEWQVDEYLDSLTDKESIVIGIEHGNEKRIDELTPYKHDKYGGGNGDAYLSFIRQTLKPHIDVAYRTLKDKQNTSICGSSLGGLISFYAILKYPETFNNALVFSPSFWFSEAIFEMAQETVIPDTSRFYFLVGTNESEDMVINQERMIDLLLNKGVNRDNIYNKIVEGGKHNEALWATYFPEAYQWLYK
ncbi:MAG: alpha/beta hydrolase [Winogradskyella sp.]|nr:alpha/beta hydrolase [Winogradskyella sp.]NNK40165.1 alpha/beta hydrolase [Winogradskyella sp.]NNL82686.1 alpha/beta hydrolase [Winogradskyella sp.]